MVKNLLLYIVYWSFYQTLVELEFLQDRKIHKIKSLVVISHCTVCNFVGNINKKTLHLLFIDTTCTITYIILSYGLS